MSLSLIDVPLDLQQALERAIAEPRVILEQGVPRMLGEAWGAVSQYVANAVGPVLPPVPQPQIPVIEFAGIAAACWMGLLIITDLTGRLTARRRGGALRPGRPLR